MNDPPTWKAILMYSNTKRNVLEFRLQQFRIV